MQDIRRRPSTGTGWWSRLADGSIRRVLAHRAAGAYLCIREVCTPAQDAARNRLSDPAAMSREGIEHDRAVAAQIRCDVLRTPDPIEAYLFLGADDAAESALLEANPDLTRGDLAG